MAISTYQTYLMVKNNTAYSKLIDITEFPDLGSAPDTIDVTTLSDGQHMYINDIIDTGSLEFAANYTLTDYQALKAIEGTEKEFAIYFGEDGANGKFGFKGELAVWITGGGVGDAVGMGFSIAPSTEIAIIS